LLYQGQGLLWKPSWRPATASSSAVTQDGKLLFYRDQDQDGTGNIARPQTIGRSGWERMIEIAAGGV
jgi:hypothetical protein